MTDDPAWRKFPVFREFFLQWKAARGLAEPGTQKKAFSRDWEDLLRDAGLTSAVERREAFEDVRVLEQAGMLKRKTPSFRPEQTLRLLLPVEAEPRLRLLFADELPEQSRPFDFTSVDWVPELQFLVHSGVNAASEDLIKLNDFFRSGRGHKEINIKERSLQIFGDEKRLDALRLTTLFRDDRLSLAVLRCYTVAEPIAWEPGSAYGAPVLVIENACTWDSYCKWNRKTPIFSAIAYGGGNRFMDSVTRLRDIFAVVGDVERVLYFGDLDPQGLRIPRAASTVALRNDLPAIEPDLWSYKYLLNFGIYAPLGESNDANDADIKWLGPFGEKARRLFAEGKRIAQEGINWEWLSEQQRA